MKDDAALVTLTIGQLKDIVREAVREVHAERDKAPALLNLRALAQKLQITERSLLDLRKQGLPHSMLGDSPRFDLAEVLEWLRLRDTREIAAALAKYGKLEAEPGNELSPSFVAAVGKRARIAMPLLKPGQSVDIGGGVRISKAKKRTP